MIQDLSRIAAPAVIVCLALTLGGPTAHGSPDADEPTPAESARARRKARAEAMTADAIASLERGADFLGRQKRFSFGAEIAYDVLQPTGQMLEFGGSRDILVRRPDRLRVEAIGRDGDVMQLFFDGQSLLVDKPNEDAYVQVEKPGTLYAALDYLVDDLGAPSPLEDFLSEDFVAEVGSRIESGFYVEHAEIGGRICEHLAFRTDELDFQIWIQVGEQPLPCRLVITYKRAEGHPQFSADFRDWNFAPESDDEMFVFEPPESAERLQIQALQRELRDQRRGR